MTEPRTRWAVTAALATGTVLLFFGIANAGRSTDAAAALAVAGAASIAELAVAALALARYRQSRDPQALFVCAGFLVLAVQTGVFGIWWPLTHLAFSYFGATVGTSLKFYPPSGQSLASPAPAYVWLVGWIAAAVLFLLALPRGDRRGKPPTRPAMVFGPSLVLVALIDLVLFRLYPWPGDTLDADLGALGWTLAGAAATLLLVAAAREWRAVSPERPLHTWLAAAYLVAIPMVLAVANAPTPGTGNVQPADLLAPVVAGLAFVGFLLDQRSQDSRMRRATDRAEEVLGGRAEIASMIAHEVRGPVATVRGIASTSLTHYDRLSDDERREFLGMIATESRRLLTTVDQMSLALKIDAGSLQLHLIPQDLAGMVRAGVDAAEPGAHPFTLDTEPGVSVPADRTRLIEVVRQLIDNAAKYSPPEAPIRVASHRDGDQAVIEIVDAGPGIPPEERDRLFTKFPNWRPTGYEEQPGTGLGLFICRGLVAEHSGEIDIADGPDGGTMLRVRLPVEG